MTPPYRALSIPLESLASHFHPLHWEDLRKSGLSADTVSAAGLFSCPPHLISKIIGFDTPEVRSALAFPYPHIDGFTRVKVFPPLSNEKGQIKYLQRKGSGSHLYFTPNFMRRVESGMPIVICEGEKKALAADQAGRCAVGISGIYGWTKKGSTGLINDFDLVPLQGRKVWIIPDGDFRENPMVRSGAYGLFEHLSRRGANAFIIDLNLWKQAA